MEKLYDNIKEKLSLSFMHQDLVKQEDQVEQKIKDFYTTPNITSQSKITDGIRFNRSSKLGSNANVYSPTLILSTLHNKSHFKAA